MSAVELLWLVLIFSGILLALWFLWAETVTAYYQWRHERKADE